MSKPDALTQRELTPWRDALVDSCAQLLGRPVSELQAEFDATARAAQPPAFAPRSVDEHAPRDLTDYVIMSTLKARRTTSDENACSWFFNLMDRTGRGYVLRDEFVRYAPYMSPIADAAVARTVFDLLVAAQQDDDEEDAPEQEPISREQPERNSGLRRRRPRRTLLPSVASLNRLNASSDTNASCDDSASADEADTSSLPASLAPSRHLFPVSVALQYLTWNKYYTGVLKKYYEKDADWERVKRDVGLDMTEVLVKSEGAIVHAELLPTMGKLYLSQRYLVFHAAVGRNHYVARLGAISNVRMNAIPYLMRDCFEVFLNSDTQAAMEGVTAATQTGAGAAKAHVESLPEHIGLLMRQFTAGDKPLSFSLMEFRDTARRDNWVTLLKELVSAYKLHVQMGFGTTGRASPLNPHRRENGDAERDGENVDPRKDDDVASDEEGQRRQNDKRRRSGGGGLNAYEFSPFRNEPPTPLLVIAAHANVARYRALRRVTARRRTQSLLVFSHAERNGAKVNWYVDSVRQFDSWNEKSWIERLVSSIRDNMAANERVYRAQDEQPFDLRVLATSIGRLAELCEPFARSVQYLNHLFQWQNPPATILAILVSSVIAIRGYVPYVPAMVLFGQAAWIVETRMKWFGVGMARSPAEDVEEQQQNVLQMVAQVRDALQAAQNVITRLNVFLGKVQTLCLWRAQAWQSWVAVAAVLVTMLVFAFVPANLLFMALVGLMFGKHFLPPSNPALRFWEQVPSRVDNVK